MASSSSCRRLRNKSGRTDQCRNRFVAGKLRATVADHNSRKKSCVPAVPSSLPHLRNDADIDMDFALIDHDTAVFALDNVIYKMVRAPTQ
jgi:hypothetical protein